jgi:hypothetical protein
MKINEILVEAEPIKLTGKTTPTQPRSALGSFLRGAGATQGADAVDAYANANALAPGVRQVSDQETDAANAKRARFIAIIKQQADRQGSISMTDIGKQIPKQGEYADPARRREAIKNVAQELQQQGVTVTSTSTPAVSTASTTTEPYSIGGQQLDPNKPSDKAIIDKLKTAQAAKPKTAQTTKPPRLKSQQPEQPTGYTYFTSPPTPPPEEQPVQQPAETPLPDISTLTPEERAELRRRLQAA